MMGTFGHLVLYHLHDEDTLTWLEVHLQLIALSPREHDLSVTDGALITKEKVEKLSFISRNLWKALMARDLVEFAQSMTKSFQAQVALYPKMLNDHIREIISKLPPDVLGYKLCGAGGGGYLLVVSEKLLAHSLKIRIRRA
ncbi:hypothetical protein [Pasteurella multocida]|uniref:hypothetical protein n=1 Tax=Pasteurella multocida TaxID=747 RepID=UPI001C3F41A4|nr:hypothetical protein [Pasteurella multocida]MDY0631923.1 hypothetical protein [Pasteurella multocida]